MHSPNLPPLRDIIAQFGLNARKSLGQHFLLDGNITTKIANIAGDLTGVHAIEIGPGPGGLTRALLASKAQDVTAVEMDERCILALEELGMHFPGRLSLIAGDAMEVDLPALVPAPRAVVANLPYNVGTAMLVRWLDDIYRDPNAYQSMTLMFQKEVADRLFSAPDHKNYGRLSVITQWLCNVEHAFDLPPEAFTPPPKVTSTVVKLTPLPAPRFLADKKKMEAVLASAFGQRRKMLRQSLKAYSADPEVLLAGAGIDPTRRAETLSVEEFCRLTLS